MRLGTSQDLLIRSFHEKTNSNLFREMCCVRNILSRSNRFVCPSGAFLIPYILSLVFMGLPVFLFEMGSGQFSSEGKPQY